MTLTNLASSYFQKKKEKIFYRVPTLNLRKITQRQCTFPLRRSRNRTRGVALIAKKVFRSLSILEKQARLLLTLPQS